VSLQAEALGILGVNLVHAALTRSGNHYDVISALLDDLSRDRVEVRAGHARQWQVLKPAQAGSQTGHNRRSMLPTSLDRTSSMSIIAMLR